MEPRAFTTLCLIRTLPKFWVTRAREGRARVNGLIWKNDADAWERVRVIGLVLPAQFQPHTIITLCHTPIYVDFAGSRVRVGDAHAWMADFASDANALGTRLRGRVCA